MTDVPTLEKKIFPIVLKSMVEAETFSGHPHIYSPFVFTLWDSENLQSLLQCKIVNTDRKLSEGCQIIVDLGKMYHDKIKMFHCKINY